MAKWISAASASPDRDAHIGVNLDSAEEQGVEISEEVMEEAIAVVQGGRPVK